MYQILFLACLDMGRKRGGGDNYTIYLDSKIVDVATVDRKVLSLMETNSEQATCKICGKVSTGKNRTQDIKSHVERHLNELTFICNYCQRTYSTRSDFRSHKTRTCTKLNVN